MREVLNIRVSQKNAAIIKRIKAIADAKDGAQQFTPTLIEFLELGLTAYDNGLRAVEHQLIDLKEKSPLALSVDREVARSVYPHLCAIITHLIEHEENKLNPSQKKIIMYKSTIEALVNQKIDFPSFTTENINNIFKTLSPVLKKLNENCDSIVKREEIFDANKQVFLDLLK